MHRTLPFLKTLKPPKGMFAGLTDIRACSNPFPRRGSMHGGFLFLKKKKGLRKSLREHKKSIKVNNFTPANGRRTGFVQKVLVSTPRHEQTHACNVISPPARVLGAFAMAFFTRSHSHWILAGAAGYNAGVMC